MYGNACCQPASSRLCDGMSATLARHQQHRYKTTTPHTGTVAHGQQLQPAYGSAAISTKAAFAHSNVAAGWLAGSMHYHT